MNNSRNFPEWAGNSWRLHAVVWSVFALLCALVLALFLAYCNVNVWEGWVASHELHRPCYTERIYVESIFRTRANTWSNLAYVLVGLYAVALAARDVRRGGFAYLKKYPAMGVLFGVACCYLGVGSGVFHASLTRWGQQLDVAAMYSPVVVLLAINLGRRFPLVAGIPTWPFLAVAAVAASALLYVYKWSMSSGTVLPLLIAGVVACASIECFLPLGRMRSRWFWLAFGALASAIFFRRIEIMGKFTGPDCWLQGHVLWHFLTAACLMSIYLYYRSEEDRREQSA